MKNLNAWLVILAGVLLGFHAARVFNLLEGAGSWAIAVVVLLIGIFQLIKNK